MALQSDSLKPQLLTMKLNCPHFILSNNENAIQNSVSFLTLTLIQLIIENILISFLSTISSQSQVLCFNCVRLKKEC